jgi:hypothetical protein
MAVLPDAKSQTQNLFYGVNTGTPSEICSCEVSDVNLTAKNILI